MSKIGRILKWIFARPRCFLCRKRFHKGDQVVEFFGGFAHYTCFDKQMQENEERGK